MDVIDDDAYSQKYSSQVTVMKLSAARIINELWDECGGHTALDRMTEAWLIGWLLEECC